MPKMPLSWHQECLENSRRSLEAERKELDNRRQHFEWKLGKHQVYQAQVERAVREGRDGFDSERFNVSTTSASAPKAEG